jgi:serine/threonine protein kinase
MIKLLGTGAYAKVFLVQHTLKDSHGAILSQKQYAMKVLNKDQLIENDLEEQTFQERDVLLQINHPFILNLHFAF